jgi:hypothetical protein
MNYMEAVTLQTARIVNMMNAFLGGLSRVHLLSHPGAKIADSFDFGAKS